MIPALQVGGLPNDSYAFSNALYVHPDLFRQLGGENPETLVYLELKDFILPVKGDKKIPTGQIAMGNLHRQMMRISKIDTPVPKSKETCVNKE